MVRWEVPEGSWGRWVLVPGWSLLSKMVLGPSCRRTRRVLRRAGPLLPCLSFPLIKGAWRGLAGCWVWRVGAWSPAGPQFAALQLTLRGQRASAMGRRRKAGQPVPARASRVCATRVPWDASPPHRSGVSRSRPALPVPRSGCGVDFPDVLRNPLAKQLWLLCSGLGGAYFCKAGGGAQLGSGSGSKCRRHARPRSIPPL